MSLTKRWLLTNLLAYQRTSYMFEKYNATALGFGGSGGEYSPQAGFGWTNGVVFDLLQRFGPELPSLEL